MVALVLISFQTPASNVLISEGLELGTSLILQTDLTDDGNTGSDRLFSTSLVNTTRLNHVAYLQLSTLHLP